MDPVRRIQLYNALLGDYAVPHQEFIAANAEIMR